MGEFEDKLNGILNDPAQMEKIMMLARGFMGGGEQNPPAQPTVPPGYYKAPHTAATPHQQKPPYYPPPQGAAAPYPPGVPYGQPYPPQGNYYPPPGNPVPQNTNATTGGMENLLGGMDLNMIKKLAKGLSGQTGSAALLQAMHPHLKDERQGQLKRAVAIAQMLKAAKSIFD